MKGHGEKREVAIEDVLLSESNSVLENVLEDQPVLAPSNLEGKKEEGSLSDSAWTLKESL